MEGKERHKHRLKGLFSKEKEKKPPTDDDDLNSFLHGPSDQLNFPAPAPNPGSQALPRLTKIDTNSARRWPTAAEIEQARSESGKSASPRRRRKGLVVRFTEQQPEIIGDGGELAEEPTISLRKRANTQPQDARTADLRQPERESQDNFRPAQIRRTQTGFDSIPDVRVDTSGASEVDKERNGRSNSASFAAKVKADMQAGEGRALVQATSEISKEIDQAVKQSGDSPRLLLTEGTSHLDQLQINTLRNSYIQVEDAPPPDVPSHLVPVSVDRSPPLNSYVELDGTNSTSRKSTGNSPSHSHAELDGSNSSSRKSTGNTLLESPVPLSRVSTSNAVSDSPKPISRSNTLTIQDAAIALGDEAMREFSARVAHLFTLFRLSSESIQSFARCSLEDVIKPASWWFLRGRLNLEATIREQPTSPQSQQATFLLRQQAYADLAKSLWLVEQVIPQFQDVLSHSSDPVSIADAMEMQHGIMTSMRKLTMSMKRNNFLPPEDAPLPQGLDPAIWMQDEGNTSLLASQRQSIVMKASELMPFGDTARVYHFARMFAKATLIEDAQQYRCTALVSLGRGSKEKPLSMTVTNQSGSLQVCVQGDRNRGPTWDHVMWNAKSNVIEIKLPRGFLLRIDCSQNDFRIFTSIYEYETRIHSDMKPRRDETIIYESTLRAFQRFGKSSFPKEPLPYCQVRLFERSAVEKAATGTRNFHRGFRLALVTHPSAKSVRGVTQDLPSIRPTQFGFLRGEGGLPAFLLKVDDGKQTDTMVFTFDNPNERSLLHSRLTGVALAPVEGVVAEVPIKSFALSDHISGSKDWSFLKTLPWQSVRIINQEQADVQSGKTVLSDNLRIVMDFKTGSFTDRLNVEPGELKIRLSVNSSTEIKVLRRPQVDMTTSISESQVSKDLPPELAEMLSAMTKAETIRKYLFPTLTELHLFQAALTGFFIVFDGMAASLNISRRRMVVPIYKKWESSHTRIQVVKKEKVIQLAAFFENFSHGDCMNFTLKSTDVFETSNKSGKYSMRIVDAKFALPKGHEETEKSVEREFVCLDMPEYPGEHDDITIVFDQEQDRDNLARVLPAPVKIASRMPSVRR